MSRWKLEELKALYGDASKLAYTPRSMPIPAKGSGVIKNQVESESRAQIRFVQYLYEIDIPFYSVPNGANVSTGNRQTLLAEGMRPGMTDLVFPIARGWYFGLYMELKREDGGSGLSEEQKMWQRILREQGYLAVKCDGYDKALEMIEWYLSLESFTVTFENTILSFMNMFITSKGTVSDASIRSLSFQMPDF